MNKGTMFTLETIFNKKVEEITKSELDSVENIAVSTKNIFGGTEDIDFVELFEAMPNLKVLTIKEKEITSEDIELLAKTNLVEIDFIKCSFVSDEDLAKLMNIKKLLLRNCQIKDYSFLNKGLANMEKLFVENPQDETEIDLSLLANKDKLTELVLQRCLVTNLNQIGNLKLSLLSLLWTDLKPEEIDTLNNIPTLEKLFISEKYENLPEISQVVSTGIVRTNLNEFFVDKEENEKTL